MYVYIHIIVYVDDNDDDLFQLKNFPIDALAQSEEKKLNPIVRYNTARIKVGYTWANLTNMRRWFWRVAGIMFH